MSVGSADGGLGHRQRGVQLNHCEHREDALLLDLMKPRARSRGVRSRFPGSLSDGSPGEMSTGHVSVLTSAALLYTVPLPILGHSGRLGVRR